MKIFSFRLLLLIACVAIAAATAEVCAQSTADEAAPMAGPESFPSDAEEDKTGGDVFDFRLVGIAVSGRPDQSLAVIEGRSDGRQRFCHEGDLVGGLEVRRILRDRLIVAAGGGERVVLLNRTYSDSAGAVGNLLPEPPASALQPPPRRIQEVEIESERLLLAQEDIDKAFQAAEIKPVSVYGRPVGVRISPIESGSIFREIGLKTGDIITGVDGKVITGPDEALAFFEQIREGGEFDIRVKGSRSSRTVRLIVH